MINKDMNMSYEKYLKGKTTSLLVKNKTKEELNNLRYEVKLKSMDDLLNFLLNHYEKYK